MKYLIGVNFKSDNTKIKVYEPDKLFPELEQKVLGMFSAIDIIEADNKEMITLEYLSEKQGFLDKTEFLNVVKDYAVIQEDKINYRYKFICAKIA